MKERRHRPPALGLDDELIAFHEDDPELLALADAIAATQDAANWRRRRRVPLAAAALALAIAVAALGTVVFSGESQAGVVDDARRALERGDVLHAVVETELPNDVVVDLARGVTTPSRQETAVWFETSSGRVRVAGRRNGALVVVSDEATTPAARFLRAYEQALASDAVSDVSEDERRFTIEVGDVAAVVAIGADDLPVAFTPRGGEPVRFARVSVADAIPPVVVPAAPAPLAGMIIAKETVSAAAAARRARFAPLAPASLADLPRRQVLLESLTTSDARGALVGSGVSVLYSDGRRFVSVSQARAPAAAYGFVDGRTAGGNPVPESPRLDLRHGSEPVGQFRVGRLFVAVRGSSRDLVVTAARELSRMR